MFVSANEMISLIKLLKMKGPSLHKLHVLTERLCQLHICILRYPTIHISHTVTRRYDTFQKYRKYKATEMPEI